MFADIEECGAGRFVATNWEPAAMKADFAKRFAGFVQSDFSEMEFSEILYVRLALSFGLLAQYNRNGFFETHFSTIERKVSFLRTILAHPCCGDPTLTYSDVERALQCWLRQAEILEAYEHRLAQESKANRAR